MFINSQKDKFVTYDDVCIIPQYSEIRSRKEVNTSVMLGDLKIDVSIISSNMDTITESDTAVAMWQAGGIGALHRFMSIDRNIDEYNIVKNMGCECLVSVGVNRDSLERAKALYNHGARYFIVDVAHGDHILVKEMLNYLKGIFKNTFVVAGNVTTPDSIKNLESWGADAIKCLVGVGAVCLTKRIAGVTMPAFSAIQACADVATVPLIADGGVRYIADICKAVGIGADFVMSGNLFSGCKECPEIDGERIYRGSASEGTMSKVRTRDSFPTPEGVSIKIEAKPYSVKKVVRDIKGGLQSACSYSNAKNIKEFQQRVVFGYQ